MNNIITAKNNWTLITWTENYGGYQKGWRAGFVTKLENLTHQQAKMRLKVEANKMAAANHPIYHSSDTHVQTNYPNGQHKDILHATIRSN